MSVDSEQSRMKARKDSFAACARRDMSTVSCRGRAWDSACEAKAQSQVHGSHGHIATVWMIKERCAVCVCELVEQLCWASYGMSSRDLSGQLAL